VRKIAHKAHFSEPAHHAVGRAQPPITWLRADHPIARVTDPTDCDE